MSNAKKGMIGLAIGALGIVFGDIGTSPLYALNVIFGTTGLHLAVTQANVFGVISLIIWSVTIVVSLKYIAFVMRADNSGEGGIMALIAQIKSSPLIIKYRWHFIALGLVGVALFYGDSTIAPAISVLSAVEGLKIVAPHLSHLVVPIALIILTSLFAIQRFGTKRIGQLFGPVMLTWFAVIALGGLWQIVQHPSVLIALSPLTAIQFFVNSPLQAFIAMSAVVLAITGAEALYADMGHFGRPPIARAWLFAVFPALILCYMGEGALLVHSSGEVGSPLFLLFPDVLRLPVVLLATAATIIASQSVISGAFSLTKQAVQLNFLPKLLIRHTSTQKDGQIYLPFVNAVMFVTVVVLILLFGSSANLASAYGVAVSGTLAIDTILYLVVMRRLWQRPRWQLGLAMLAFIPIDLLFVTSNIPKIFEGGWFPLLVGSFILLLITTWLKGQKIVAHERHALEGSLQHFITTVHQQQPVPRIPGTAIYISHHPGMAPLALHATLRDLHELHEKVIIVSVQSTTVAHIPNNERAVIDELGDDTDGISHVSLSFGFHDVMNVPEVLQSLRTLSPELNFDPKKASYFVSLSNVIMSKRHGMSLWRKALYIAMNRNALSVSDYYKLPAERTVEMRTLIKL
jgi:KUP system potassium uptake protein